MSDSSSVTQAIKVFDHTETSENYQARFCVADGDIRSSLAAAPGYDLWALTAELAAGASLTWTQGHGEEGIYVISGAISTDAGTARPGDLLVLETGARCTGAATEPTTLLHVGSTPPPASEIDETTARVHLFPDGKPTAEFAAGEGVRMGTRIFVDGTSPSFRLNFLKLWSDGPTNAPAHCHSQDELIHVVTGALHVGPLTVSAGSTIAIPEDRFYAFRTDDSFSFVNYRREQSWITMGSDREPEPETIEWAVRNAPDAALQV